MWEKGISEYVKYIDMHRICIEVLKSSEEELFKISKKDLYIKHSSLKKIPKDILEGSIPLMRKNYNDAFSILKKELKKRS